MSGTAQSTPYENGASSDESQFHCELCDEWHPAGHPEDNPDTADCHAHAKAVSNAEYRAEIARIG